jgi:excisionase family DNA binding protein
MSNDRLALSVNEFCQRTSISRATLYRLAARGDVALRKLGSRTVVPMAEVHRLLGTSAATPLPGEAPALRNAA